MTAPSVPFTAFTEAARQAVVLARGDAYALGHERLGTEHLLLGLLGVQEGLAAQVLSSFAVTPEVVRDRLVRMGQPDAPVVAVEEITVIPRSRKVLEVALREAIVLGFSAVETEHILLAILDEDECVAAGVLRELVTEADPEIRSAVIRSLSRTHPHVLRSRPVPFQATPRSTS